MSRAAGRPEFDQQERERIQRALRRYMEEHRIGTPTLQLRIMEADEPHRRELPLSTLQRFVTGSHRTSDAYVEMCSRFLQSVGAADAPEFGEALFAFLQEPAVPANGKALAGTLAEKFAGEFESRTRPASQGGEMPYPPESELIESQASFAPAPGRPYLNVREFVRDLRNVDRAPDRRHPYDGALVAAGPLVHVMLRSSLTRQPKLYTLAEREIEGTPESPVVLEGEGFETGFLRADPQRERMSRNFRVQFVPRKEEGQAP